MLDFVFHQVKSPIIFCYILRMPKKKKRKGKSSLSETKVLNFLMSPSYALLALLGVSLQSWGACGNSPSRRLSQPLPPPSVLCLWPRLLCFHCCCPVLPGMPSWGFSVNTCFHEGTPVLPAPPGTFSPLQNFNPGPPPTHEPLHGVSFMEPLKAESAWKPGLPPTASALRALPPPAGPTTDAPKTPYNDRSRNNSWVSAGARCVRAFTHPFIEEFLRA